MPVRQQIVGRKVRFVPRFVMDRDVMDGLAAASRQCAVVSNAIYYHCGVADSYFTRLENAFMHLIL